MNPVPHRAERLVRWSLAPSERAAVLGDLEEEARTIAEDRGEYAARQWYWRQAARSVAPNLARRIRAYLKRPDELRFTAMFAASPFWSAVVDLAHVRHTMYVPREFDLAAATMWAVGFLLAFHRRWLQPERPIARRSWWVISAIFAVSLVLMFVHVLPPRAALVVSGVWAFWPSRPAVSDSCGQLACRSVAVRETR
jgi:hypothetical protein